MLIAIHWRSELWGDQDRACGTYYGKGYQGPTSTVV